MFNIMTSIFRQLTESTVQNATIDNAPTLEGFEAATTSLWPSFPVLQDGVKLFVIGGAIEMIRRLVYTSWDSFIGSFFINAEFDERDDSFSEHISYRCNG